MIVGTSYLSNINKVIEISFLYSGGGGGGGGVTMVSFLLLIEIPVF